MPGDHCTKSAGCKELLLQGDACAPWTLSVTGAVCSRYGSLMFDLVLAWLVSVVGVATGAAYVPQAARIWKRRSSDDVSILTYLLFLGGQLVYFVYGTRIAQWPLIIGMAANIAGSLAVIGSAMRFRGGERKSEE